MTDGGTYTLVVSLPEGALLEVGALGTVEFPAGGYAYTGSALGSGGFARVARHRRIDDGDHGVRHWHVDYLLGHPETEIETTFTADGDHECRVARALGTGPVEGFGASDCECRSHLAWREDGVEMRAAVEDTYASIDGDRDG